MIRLKPKPLTQSSTPNTMKITRRLLLSALLLASLAPLHAEQSHLPPPGWDPKRAGDEVLSKMIKVSAPQVKGAHDADLVLVGERAFIVEHDNDIKPGHGAGKAQYCVLTVVNVKTMSVERVVPMAKSAQTFANETLPVGACFVPRIIQMNDTTLRCFFVCEDQSGKSQSQTWYPGGCQDGSCSRFPAGEGCSQPNFVFIPRAASTRSSTVIRRTRSISACKEAFAQALARGFADS